MMSNLFMWLFGFSLVGYLVAFIKPSIFYRFIKGEPSRKKSLELTSIVTLVFLLLWFISAHIIDAKKKDNGVENNSATTSASITQEAVDGKIDADASTIDKLWGAIDLSRKTREGYDVRYDETSKSVDVAYNPSNGYLGNETMIVKTALVAFVKFGIEAFKIDGVNSIYLTYKGNFIDDYGKESLRDILVFAMNKDEFSKYDWVNLANNGSPINTQFKESCLYYYIHPSISSEVDFEKIYLNLNL